LNWVFPFLVPWETTPRINLMSCIDISSAPRLAYQPRRNISIRASLPLECSPRIGRDPPGKTEHEAVQQSIRWSPSFPWSIFQSWVPCTSGVGALPSSDMSVRGVYIFGVAVCLNLRFIFNSCNMDFSFFGGPVVSTGLSDIRGRKEIWEPTIESKKWGVVESETLG